MDKKSLLYKISLPSNLRSAWNELNKINKESRGLSDETIQSFGTSLNSNLATLRKQLKNGTFKFSEVRGTTKLERKPSGKIKKRPIRIPEIKDRLVQRAIARYIELPLHKKYNLRNGVSFAYLKKIGIRDALKRMLEFYKRGCNVCFETDIIGFFDCIDKEKLFHMITYALRDDSINSLIWDSLNQEVGNITDFSSGDQRLFANDGIPQGGALSPLFANVYLSDFDAEMLRQGFHLIRYADDFIVMCRSMDEAQRAHEFSKNFLKNQLGLSIHELSKDKGSKTKIVKIGQESLSFLGSTFTGRYIYPSKESINKIQMKILGITQYKEGKTLLMVLNQLKSLLEGWISSFCHTSLDQRLIYIDKLVREKLYEFCKRIQWTPNPYRITKKLYINVGLPHPFLILMSRREKLFKQKKFELFKDYWRILPRRKEEM